MGNNLKLMFMLQEQICRRFFLDERYFRQGSLITVLNCPEGFSKLRPILRKENIHLVAWIKVSIFYP